MRDGAANVAITTICIRSDLPASLGDIKQMKRCATSTFFLPEQETDVDTSGQDGLTGFTREVVLLAVTYMHLFLFYQVFACLLPGLTD